MDNTEVRVGVEEDEAWFRHIKYSTARWSGRRVGSERVEEEEGEMSLERGTHCADWSASSSPPRAAFQSKLILTIPVAFFDLRQCGGREVHAQCRRHGGLREGATFLSD